ncbi:MAG TPA: 50S ribosomal protein L9 [Candidatus Paceibacterota bacterium]
MKIILLCDIPRLGRKNDIKNVADGYALHFLIPRGFAIEAIAQNLAQRKKVKEVAIQQKGQESEAYEVLRQALEGKTIAIYKPADKKGNLYAGVSAKDILQALRVSKISLPASLQEHHIIIDTPIKIAGEYQIQIKYKTGELAFAVVVNLRPAIRK